MLYPDIKELIALKKEARLLKVAAAKQVSTSSIGKHASPYRGQGLEFEEVRTYEPGDDVRNIDWRVTARTNEPHTKVFREDKQRSVYLLLDYRRKMHFGTQGTFKSIALAKIASLLGWYHQLDQDLLGALIFGKVKEGKQVIPLSNSRKSLWHLFKLLCEEFEDPAENGLHPSEYLNLTTSLAPKHSLIYVISDFSDDFTPEYSKNLGKLSRINDLILIKINDPSDYLIPAIGQINFANQNKSISVNTNQQFAKIMYQEQWKSLDLELEKITKKYAIPLIKTSTNHDFLKDLNSELNKIGLHKRIKK